MTDNNLLDIGINSSLLSIGNFRYRYHELRKDILDVNYFNLSKTFTLM